MRRLALFIAMGFCCANAQAQYLDCEAGRARVQRVVEMPGKDAAEIYRLAQRWVALTFRNKDEVIQTEIENELVRGDGYEPKAIRMAGSHQDFSYSFAIDIKDQRLRFTLQDMKVGYPNARNGFAVENYLFKADCSARNIPLQTKGVREGVEAFSSKLMLSLASALAEVKEDW